MKVTHKTLDAASETQGQAETPSQKIVREARPLRTVTDENGRKIVYRRLGVLEEARLARILGAELSSNYGYLLYAKVAVAVQSIDGDPGVQPTKPTMVEARIGWIGDEAFNAVYEDMLQVVEEQRSLRENDEVAASSGDHVKN